MPVRITASHFPDQAGDEIAVSLESRELRVWRLTMEDWRLQSMLFWDCSCKSEEITAGCLAAARRSVDLPASCNLPIQRVCGVRFETPPTWWARPRTSTSALIVIEQIELQRWVRFEIFEIFELVPESGTAPWLAG